MTTTTNPLDLDCLDTKFESGIEFSRRAQADLIIFEIVFEIRQVAVEALMAYQLRIATFETIETNVRKSGFWPAFVGLVARSQVPDDWLPGALGELVVGWARLEQLVIDADIPEEAA